MNARHPSALTEEQQRFDALARDPTAVSSATFALDRRGFLAASMTAAGGFLLLRHAPLPAAAAVSMAAASVAGSWPRRSWLKPSAP